MTREHAVAQPYTHATQRGRRHTHHTQATDAAVAEATNAVADATMSASRMVLSFTCLRGRSFRREFSVFAASFQCRGPRSSAAYLVSARSRREPQCSQAAQEQNR